MPRDPLKDPKLKIKRAKRHIADTQAAVSTFLGRHPYRMFEEVDPKSGWKDVKVSLSQPIPDDVSVTSADAIHNLRVALDQLTVCLAILNGHTDTSGTYFPFGKSRQVFKSPSVQRKIQKLSRDARDLIASYKPYHGGNDLLWSLHALDIMDKHNMLVPIGTHTTSINFRNLKVSGPAKIMTPKWNPTEESMTVLRLGPEAKLNGNISFPFEIAFRDVQPVKHQPIIAVLNQLTSLVERILLTFERRFFT